jgi:hypothetical protein
VCCIELDDPGAHSFIDSVSEGAGAGFDSDDLSAEELDSEDIQGLASYVLLDGCQYGEIIKNLA